MFAMVYFIYKVIHLTNETPEALNLFKSGGVLKSRPMPCRRSEVARDVVSRARIIKGVKIVENDIYFLRGPIPSSVVFYPLALYFFTTVDAKQEK